jgi:hypothetical protein
MGIVIVVGIDGVGKSPLIRLIETASPYYRALLVAPTDPNVAKDKPGSTIRIAVEQIRQWGLMNGRSSHSDATTHVYDRFPYPDEFVYGPLFGGSAIREQDLDVWDAICVSHGVKFVYIEPERDAAGSLEPYCKRMTENPDPYVHTENGNVAQGLLERYEVVMGRSSVPWLRLQYKWFDVNDAKNIDWVEHTPRGDARARSTAAA